MRKPFHGPSRNINDRPVATRFVGGRILGIFPQKILHFAKKPSEFKRICMIFDFRGEAGGGGIIRPCKHIDLGKITGFLENLGLSLCKKMCNFFFDFPI